MFNISYIGLRIKELRRRKKLSQEELAELIDVNFRTIQRLETGKNIPSLETLTKLAEAFEIDICDLFAVEHLASREEIINNINIIANNLDDEHLRIFYRTINSFYK